MTVAMHSVASQTPPTIKPATRPGRCELSGNCVPCAADNVPNLAQVFDVYKTLLQNPGFLTQNGIPNATEAAEFINAVSSHR